MDIELKNIRDGSMIISHPKTEYQIVYTFDESTYPYIFNPDGTPKDNPNFAIDPFRSVEVIDINNDGAEEVVMKQYVSLGWRANQIGELVTVWKFMGIDGKLTLISIELVNK